MKKILKKIPIAGLSLICTASALNASAEQPLSLEPVQNISAENAAILLSDSPRLLTYEIPTNLLSNIQTTVAADISISNLNNLPATAAGSTHTKTAIAGNEPVYTMSSESADALLGDPDNN